MITLLFPQLRHLAPLHIMTHSCDIDCSSLLTHICVTRPQCGKAIALYNNTPIAQIPPCIRQISHNELYCNRNVYMYAQFCYKNCALWDMRLVQFGICATDLLVHRFYRYDGAMYVHSETRVSIPTNSTKFGFKHAQRILFQSSLTNTHWGRVTHICVGELCQH